ncbi:MAG: prephenate dehydrogenase/arogenate dehydrogenase family protein [Clostridia bacterium]|nr:prephenate dehydrogenase/arogenate dehydrogenase family protein [Clostridia bacterium]
MNICIAGLGLIGGSFAKAISQRTNHFCMGIDTNANSCKKALDDGAIKQIISPQQLSLADLVILALQPKTLVQFFKTNAKYIKKGAIVFDTCGVKQAVLNELVPVAQQYGIKFVGAHPMAGREFSGYDYALENLFDKASFIVTTDNADKTAVDVVCNLAKQIGFASVTVTTADHHDRVIAYTSQLAHVVSNSYCKSETIAQKQGFCAGSFADMTRVGKLDVNLWTELFLSNSAHLGNELGNLIQKLTEFKVAIDDKDEKTLSQLLKEGNDIKVKSLADE